VNYLNDYLSVCFAEDDTNPYANPDDGLFGFIFIEEAKILEILSFFIPFF